MTEHGRLKPSDELRQVASRRPHLMDHLKKFKQITGEFPEFIDEADRSSVTSTATSGMKYYAIEPELSEDETTVFKDVRDRLLERSVNKPAPTSETEYDDRIEELLQETTAVTDGASDESGVLSRFSKLTNLGTVEVTEQTTSSAPTSGTSTTPSTGCSRLPWTSVPPRSTTSGSRTWASASATPSPTPTRSSTRRCRTGRVSISSTPTTSPSRDPRSRSASPRTSPSLSSRSPSGARSPPSCRRTSGSVWRTNRRCSSSGRPPPGRPPR